jgi:hypothetical protein
MKESCYFNDKYNGLESMRYISIKNSIKIVALAMIAFPEPVSTVLGIMILGATFAVYRQKSLNTFGNAEDLIQRSLQNPKKIGFRDCFSTEQPVVNHMLKASILSQPMRNPKISIFNPVIHQYYSWFDNRKVSETVLHHTLKTSFPQYEEIPESLQPRNLRKVELKLVEQGIQHHKLKMSLIPEANSGLH